MVAGAECISDVNLGLKIFNPYKISTSLLLYLSTFLPFYLSTSQTPKLI